MFRNGHGDIAAAVRAMREGALDFIEKPFKNARLLARVRIASGRTPSASGPGPDD